jgi:hypothetical protein
MLKYIIAAVAAMTISSVALAEGLSTSVGTERNLETEINSVYSSVSYGIATVTTTLEDTAADNMKFNLSTVEVDFAQPIGTTGVEVYMNNDFDDNFKHSSTVVGAKFTF